MPAPRLDEQIGPGGETREWLILASIRAGGYPHVAAEAYGVSADQFLRGTQRDQARKIPRKLRRLAAPVREAVARARLKAEMAVYDADLRFWLQHGPGKETRRTPGWSTLAKPVFETDGESDKDLLASKEFQRILTGIDRALAAFPEARVAAAAAALNEK
jgi:hypothetical protein